MRILHYGILNTKTLEKKTTGANLKTANEKLNELQKNNPNNEYKIIYRYVSI